MHYYEYQQRHKEYILDKGFVLIKEGNNLNLDYKGYIEKIKQQWKEYPDYPFYQLGLPLETTSSISKLFIPGIVREEGYSFVSTKVVSDTIYYDSNKFDTSNFISDAIWINNNFIFNDGDIDLVNDEQEGYIEIERLVWEFVKERDRGSNKYLYIEPNASLINYLDIPVLCYWDIDDLDKTFIYPNENYLLGLSSTHWKSWYSLIVEDMTHPFLKGFIFSGRVIEQGEERLLGYEYMDYKGLYGIKNEVYISPLKPIELDFPLGLPDVGQVDILKCNQPLVNYYPSKGIMPYELGRFTGYTTNNKYHPSKIFYLYEREDNTVFASESKPNKYSIDVLNINYQICNGLTSGITLKSPIESKEYIYIEDIGECASIGINIKDYTCPPSDYKEERYQDILSDCVIISDDYYVSDSDDIIINDLIMIDDYLYIEGFVCSSLYNTIDIFDDSTIIDDLFINIG